MMRARTVKTSVGCTGIGLHSGRDVRLTVLPAPAGTGILFRRIDLLKSAGPQDQASGLERITIAASPLVVTSATLGTVLTNRFGVSVSTVEHLLAAFAGFGITNAIVELDGPEVPIVDGSAAPFIEMIQSVGLRDLSAEQQVYVLDKPVQVKLGESVITAVPLEDVTEAVMRADVTIEFGDEAIGRQRIELDNAYTQFCDELADARTFCYLRDVEAMRAKGLALGGSYDNAIVVSDGEVLNEDGLRMEREFVRHKTLDMIGDFYLLGAPLVANVTAFRPGHDINTRFARAVIEEGAATLTRLSGQASPAQQALA